MSGEYQGRRDAHHILVAMHPAVKQGPGGLVNQLAVHHSCHFGIFQLIAGT